MTDYVDVPTIFTGDWIDAAWINQYIGDNFRAIKQGLAATGDVAYALDANTIAALSKPDADGLFKMSSLGVPSYFPIADLGDLAGLLHAYGSDYTDSVIGTTSTSYATTDVKFNLVLEHTCTVVVIVTGVAYKDSGGYEGYFKIAVNGALQTNEPIAIKNTQHAPLALFTVFSGVPAGTRLVDLQYKTQNAGDTLYLGRAELFALAFIE